MYLYKERHVFGMYNKIFNFKEPVTRYEYLFKLHTLKLIKLLNAKQIIFVMKYIL